MIKCNLNILLAERRMTIQDLSDKTKLSRTTISALVNESGKGIQFDTMDTICKFFGITPGELFSYVEINYSIEPKFLGDQTTSHHMAKTTKLFDLSITSEISTGQKYFNGEFNMEVSLFFDEKNEVVASSFKEKGKDQTFSKFIKTIPFMVEDQLRDEIYSMFKEVYNIDIPKQHLKNASSIFL